MDRKSRRIPVPSQRNHTPANSFPRSFPGAAPAAHFPSGRQHHHTGDSRALAGCSRDQQGHHQYQHNHHSHHFNWNRGAARSRRVPRARYESTREPTSRERESIRRPFHQPPPSDIPGMHFDPKTRKYFRIQNNPAAGVGFSSQDLRARQLEAERKEALTRPCGLPPQLPASTTAAILRRDLGGRSKISLSRQVVESQLWGMGVAEPTVTPVGDPGEVDQCGFLQVGRQGSCLLGVWGGRGGQHHVRSFKASVDADAASETSHGLRLSRGSDLDQSRGKVVDLCLAPVDSAVTCVLYVSMPPAPNEPYRVAMAPVPELTAAVHDPDILDSPVYNIDWAMDKDISSCAWNAHKMRLGLGMGEGYGLIVDVVSETDFRLSTRHQRVWAQEFSKDGELVFLGLGGGGGALCCDLRLPSHHTVYELPQRGVHAVRLLARDPQLLLAASLDGALQLWDLRARRVVQSYAGHVNSHSKLAVVMDEDERLLFAGRPGRPSTAGSLRRHERRAELDKLSSNANLKSGFTMSGRGGKKKEPAEAEEEEMWSVDPPQVPQMKKENLFGHCAEAAETLISLE